ncbi:MAG: hypothetical protein IJ759_07535 [Bacteroidales bacterium]|nr:hypothetical protein [Bacteroidales bacterium]
MNDLIREIALPILTGIIGWFSNNYMSKRSKKKDDLSVITDCTQNLIEALTKANEKINDLTNRLIKETEEKLQYLNRVTALEKEKISLNAKIDKMQRDINELKQVINRLSKNKTKNEK